MAGEIENFAGDTCELGENEGRLANGFDLISFDDDATVPEHSLFVVHGDDHATVHHSHRCHLFLSLLHSHSHKNVCFRFRALPGLERDLTYSGAFIMLIAQAQGQAPGVAHPNRHNLRVSIGDRNSSCVQ